jgi:hypothetical protein
MRRARPDSVAGTQEHDCALGQSTYSPKSRAAPYISTMDEQLRKFMKQGFGVREVLQAVEDVLIHEGYDDYMVATARGSFHWMTVGARASSGGR